jgi:hypothetical protein
MSEKKKITRKSPLRDKVGGASVRKTQALEIAPVEINDAETDAVMVAVGSLGFAEKGIEELARGSLKMIGMENGKLTERGLNRVKGAVKFLGGLLAGKKHRDALKESGLIWAQVSSFCLACEEFEQMYNAARGKMKQSMGMTVLDTAFELATEGEAIYNKKGEAVGKKRSEKMLDRLLTLAGREFSKDVGKNVAVDPGKGGITLNFHFDGKKNGIAVETVDV